MIQISFHSHCPGQGPASLGRSQANRKPGAYGVFDLSEHFGWGEGRISSILTSPQGVGLEREVGREQSIVTHGLLFLLQLLDLGEIHLIC